MARREFQTPFIDGISVIIDHYHFVRNYWDNYDKGEMVDASILNDTSIRKFDIVQSYIGIFGFVDCPRRQKTPVYIFISIQIYPS